MADPSDLHPAPAGEYPSIEQRPIGKPCGRLKTGRHLGQCEFVGETDPAMLKILLKVAPGSGGARML
jgi:hypothetical protein